jgi:hypothetical protein
VSRMVVQIIFEAQGSKYYKRRSYKGPQSGHVSGCFCASKQSTSTGSVPKTSNGQSSVRLMGPWRSIQQTDQAVR